MLKIHHIDMFQIKFLDLNKIMFYVITNILHIGLLMEKFNFNVRGRVGLTQTKIKFTHTFWCRPPIYL
jgi:hypothetical protein